MASEKTIDIICKGFVSIFADGEEMWLQILADLKLEGIIPSFQKRYFLEILLVEWTIARLGWLFRQSEGINNPLTKKIMLNAINSEINEVFDEPDLKQAFATYYVLADSFDKNELDSLGSRMGPGPLLLKRYLDKINSDNTNISTSEKELWTIMITGDTSCWYLEKSLDEILESVLQNLE